MLKNMPKTLLFGRYDTARHIEVVLTFKIPVNKEAFILYDAKARKEPSHVRCIGQRYNMICNYDTICRCNKADMGLKEEERKSKDIFID